MSNSVEPIPERYRWAVVPHVFVNGAAAAIAFYERAFGAHEHFRIAAPGGLIVHAELRIGECVFMLGDADEGGAFEAPAPGSRPAVGLHVYVSDVDLASGRAIDAGAREIQPPQDMFYGDRVAMVADPYGHVWVLLAHQENLPVAEIKRRGEALLAAQRH